MNMRAGLVVALMGALALIVGGPRLAADKLPLNPGVQRRTTPEARNVRFVGWTDMDARADGLQVVGQGNYLYVGHLWSRGVSIVDIGDPTKPQVVKFIPAPENTWHINVQVAGNLLIIASEQYFWGSNPNATPFTGGIRLFDVSNPRDPRELAVYKTGGRGTHRNWYTGGRYAYLTGGKDGYEGNIFQIVDVSDPRNPKEVSVWAPPSTGAAPEFGGFFRGAFLHAPIVNGQRAYLAYLSDAGPGGAILDIRDPTKLTLVSQIKFNPPFGNVHTFLPLPSRKLAVLPDEATAYRCNEPMKLTWIVDLQDEKHPRPLSILPLPADYEKNCAREVRSGPHNIHENRPGSMNDEYMVYLAAFNWGLRIYDISNPFRPEEVGYYVPEDPKWKMDTRPYTPAKFEGSDLISVQDVYVDSRGYMFLTDYNGGLYVLQYTGPKPKGPSADPRRSWKPGLPATGR